MSYLKKIFGKKDEATPQSQPIPGSTQVPNSAGGFAWKIDDWQRLQRFLILGSEGGSYYATAPALTVDNAQAVQRCLERDGLATVKTIVDISRQGRAPKNEPALFALAMAASKGDIETRRAAFAALPQVARTGTFLFQFVSFVKLHRGWGRGLRQAISDWYNARDPKNLSYQAIKYQNREGWSHRDLLRLSHPKPATEAHQQLYGWITKGWDAVAPDPPSDPAMSQVPPRESAMSQVPPPESAMSQVPPPESAMSQIWAFEHLKRTDDPARVVELIRKYRLPRETVPTRWLDRPDVWEALLEDMPMTALIRNLATLTRVGLIAPMSHTTRRVKEQVCDKDWLRKARVHPIAMLSALKTYSQGRGQRGRHSWTPVQEIVDALDEAFYLSFGNVKPTGKRWVLAIDVSGSMTCGTIGGVPGLTPRDASAAMALITAAVESNYTIVGFSHNLAPLRISPRQRLDDVIKKVSAIPMGATDCALPMLWATQNKIDADVFAVYTDYETWFGKIHPAQALKAYREKTGRPARSVVLGMVSNGFTIADPDDPGMLDCVGFDTATPNIMHDFASGKL